MRSLADGSSVRTWRKRNKSTGVALGIVLLRPLLADALLRLGCSKFAYPGATALARDSHSPVNFDRQHPV